MLTGNPNVLYTFGQQCVRKTLAVSAEISVPVCCCNVVKKQMQRQGSRKKEQVLDFRSS